MNDDERDEARYITINHAMRIVNVSRRTIYNWIHLGKVVYRRTAGGSIRIVKDSLWIKHEDDDDDPHRRRPRRS